MDPRLLMLGLAALLLILAVAYLIASVASARRVRRQRAGRPGDVDIAPVAVSDAPIELGGWAPSAEPDERGLRIGTNFEDIAPGTVHGQDRPTHHEAVDVEPGALLSIEDLIRKYAATPVPERAPMPGASIETLLHRPGAEAAGVAEPAGAPIVEVPEPLETPRAPAETHASGYTAPDHEGSGSVAAVAASFGLSAETGPAPAEEPAPATGPRSAPPAPPVLAPETPAPATTQAPAPAAVPWFMEAGGSVPQATAPDLPTAPEPAVEFAEPSAPFPAPESVSAAAAPPAAVEAAVSEPEPDPLLLLESLLAEPTPAAVPGASQWEAAPASPPPASSVAEPPVAQGPGVGAPVGAAPAPAPAAAVPARPTARDVRQVPAYRMVAPIELWFADGPPRVGIRPGTPTYLKYQRLAQVLLNDLKKAHGQG